MYDVIFDKLSSFSCVYPSLWKDKARREGYCVPERNTYEDGTLFAPQSSKHVVSTQDAQDSQRSRRDDIHGRHQDPRR
jgi:hypothetical protein